VVIMWSEWDLKLEKDAGEDKSWEKFESYEQCREEGLHRSYGWVPMLKEQNSCESRFGINFPREEWGVGTKRIHSLTPL